MRRVLALVLVLTASASLVVACGEDQPTSASDTTSGAGITDSRLDDVTVTGADGTTLKLEFDQPFGVAESASAVVIEGDGEPVTKDSLVTFNYVIVNGTDGSEVDSSYDGDPTTVSLSGAPAFLSDALDGTAVGARVLIAIAAANGLGADESKGVSATDTLLMVIDVTGVTVPLDRAEGAAVAPVDGLPTVVLAADGAPTITVPTGEPPADLIVQPLIKGTGPVVESGQTVTAHYTGVLYADGSVFDSSWESGQPISIQLAPGGAIEGWQKGLTGQTVGSQILLVVPPEDGYGDQGSSGIPPGSTLVFVVDILAVT